MALPAKTIQIPVVSATDDEIDEQIETSQIVSFFFFLGWFTYYKGFSLLRRIHLASVDV